RRLGRAREVTGLLVAVELADGALLARQAADLRGVVGPAGERALLSHAVGALGPALARGLVRAARGERGRHDGGDRDDAGHRPPRPDPTTAGLGCVSLHPVSSPRSVAADAHATWAERSRGAASPQRRRSSRRRRTPRRRPPPGPRRAPC